MGIHEEHQDEIQQQQQQQQQAQDEEEDEYCHQYRGESSKSACIRNRGHVDKLKRKIGSFMFDHIHEKHPEIKTHEESIPIFKMDVTATDKDPMRRIIREAVKIKSVIDGEQKELN